MKFIPFLLLFCFSFSAQAQLQTVPNQYIIHFTPGTTPNEVSAIANTWCSSVIENLQPGGHIAVFQFNCNFPIANPYNPSEYIPDLIGVVGKIKKQEPKAGGGSMNYFVGGSSPGIITGNCYNENLLKDETGEASIVRVAVFDTGTNWAAANQQGFDFGIPYEMFGDCSDKHGHGTHVSSIVNKTYLESNTSITEKVSYLFGNPLDAQGQGTLAAVVLSMEDAIIHGANVVNCSFSYLAPTMEFGNIGPGGPGTNGDHAGEEDILYQLMSSADPNTTLFVVAAGNDDGFDLDAGADLNVYPAAFPLENMITVASHGCTENLSTFSNLGAQSVDIAAPGEDIVSIDHDMNLVSYSGTSQATAYVSGAASIVGTYLPVFDAEMVKCAIMNAAIPKSSFAGKTVSQGILDIEGAVDYLLSYACDPNGNVSKRLAPDDSSSKISIYPTLVKNEINIEFELALENPVDIAVYSINGQILYKITLDGTKGSNRISLNLGQLPSLGLMLIQIDSNEFSKTSKVIKIQ